MTDLRESVARAIWDKDFRPMPAWDEMTWPEKLGYQKMASAALRALAEAGFVIMPREPTDEILGAMLTAHNAFEGDHLAGNPLLWMRPAYRAAVAAAMKEMG